MRREYQGVLTPRDLLHKYLYVAVLGHRAQVADDIAVVEVLVQRYLLVQRLRVPGKQSQASVTCRVLGAWGPHGTAPVPALLLATPSFWKWSFPWLPGEYTASHM